MSRSARTRSLALPAASRRDMPRWYAALLRTEFEDYRDRHATTELRVAGAPVRRRSRYRGRKGDGRTAYCQRAAQPPQAPVTARQPRGVDPVPVLGRRVYRREIPHARPRYHEWTRGDRGGGGGQRLGYGDLRPSRPVPVRQKDRVLGHV